MPFEVDIDHDRGLVSSVWRGRVDEAECTDYIRSVWGRPAIGHYDEFVDFRAVTGFDLDTEAIQRLVTRSTNVAVLNARARSVFVADEAIVFGLSRMYVSMREQNRGDAREWLVTADYDAARAWIDTADRG